MEAIKEIVHGREGFNRLADLLPEKFSDKDLEVIILPITVDNPSIISPHQTQASVKQLAIKDELKGAIFHGEPTASLTEDDWPEMYR